MRSPDASTAPPPTLGRLPRYARDTPLAEILDEWNSNARHVEPLLDDAGEIGRQAVADVVTHEHDIRGALGRPGARDSDAITIALGFAASHLIEAAATRGVALRVQSSDGLTFAFGPGHPHVTLTADPFELLRALTGRRSVDQLSKMQWVGEYEKVIRAFWWLGLHPADTWIAE